MDIAAWLRELGLERYEQAFRENDIDAEILPKLTTEDLSSIGVASVGHRRKLLEAIGELSAASAAAEARDDAADATQPQPRADVAGPPEAERRQLTVLFCDLVGSTELSARLDPEDMSALIRAYQNTVARKIARFEGHVARFLGDGVLAYFGWPKAHEDDAERAVHAGLAVAEAVGRRTARTDEPLAARVGIATGVVVVGELFGEGAALEQAVVGGTPNLAARLQALASPGHVVISQATRRLLGSVFQLEDLGPQSLKGFAEPLAVWRVLGESEAEGRFEALRGRQLAPLVGRDEELEMLVACWRRAKHGEGQVVLLSGEPGIGKSRLLRALRERLRGEDYTSLSHYCSPFHVNSALYPLTALLERAAGFERDDPSEVRLVKLEGLLAQGTEHLDKTMPLIASLLGIEACERYRPLNLTPQSQKKKTLEVLLDHLEGEARRRPVLVIHEDAHWADPTTLELLGLVVERVRALPALVLLTFRPEFSAPWNGHAHVTQLSLCRLTRRHGAAMVEGIASGKALPSAVVDQILAKSDGVPLFVEELTRAVLESDLLEDAGDCYELTGPLPPLAIPSTLHDSLLARLDCLAPVKHVAQIGAAIGREFGYELLATVTPFADNELRQALSRLVEAELIFCRGTPPQANYKFKHALVRDAAYETLLKNRRQQLHARIADALRERFPETVEAEPESMARHCTGAGLTEEAIQYLAKAGRQALERSANAEAVGHLSKALVLLKTLPAGPERDATELDLLVAIGPPLIATKGFTDPEVKKTYLRARALCQGLGNTTQLVPVLVGLANIHVLRAELRRARELGEECLTLAQHHNDPGVLIAARRILGATLHFLGEFPRSRAQLEEANALHELHQRRFDSSLYLVSNSRVYCHSILARVLSALGYPERALGTSDEALRLAEEASHSDTLARALSLAAAFHLDRRDVQRTERLARDAVALATEHDFPYWRATAGMWWGWALAQRQEIDEGLERIQDSLAHFRAKGDVQTIPHALTVLAEVYSRIGNATKGLEALAEALAVLERTNERRRDAEIQRLRGELLLSLPGRHLHEAEACFERALAIARRQSARMWELRAATSLTRLWAKQGERQKAYDLLAPIYGWFTEGFDTADLMDARALLDEL